MLKYNQKATQIISLNKKYIYCFQSDDNHGNIDQKKVESFGEEWSEFSDFSNQEIERIGDEYFDIVNSNHLDENSIVLDLGCGSGRWTKYLSHKVKFIEAVDPSDAVLSASQFLSENKNVRVSKASVGKSLNVIINDALDRFAPPLEQRFSKKEIKQMIVNSGLGEIIFSNKQPYWHAVGIRIR
jgi:SAM-dependent methyltransferase